MLFFLKKVIAPFILPPGCFIVLLLALSGWAAHRKQRAFSLFTMAIGALLWILSIGPTADMLNRGLEADYTPDVAVHADVILMLGGDLYSGSPDFSGTGAPGPITMERLVTAARLHRKYRIPIVISGGKVFRSASQSIAGVTKRVLVDLGIPADAIILEENSRDTYENAVYSKRICETNGFKHPLLLTSGGHLKRALLSFHKIDFDVTPYPCGLTTWPGKPLHPHRFLPSAGALRATALALHEWIGLAYYGLVY